MYEYVYKKLEDNLAKYNNLVRDRLNDIYYNAIIINNYTMYIDITFPEIPDTLSWLRRETGLNIRDLVYEVYGHRFGAVYFWEEDGVIKFPNKHPFKNKLQMSKEEFWNEVENSKG